MLVTTFVVGDLEIFGKTHPSVNPFGVRAFLVGWGKIDSGMQNDEGSFGMEVLLPKAFTVVPLCKVTMHLPE
jgi:hypothetical protein